MTAINIQLF